MSNKRMLALVLAIAIVVLLAVPMQRGAARTTIGVSLFCDSQGHQVLECFATVNGGTGSYTNYQWTPTEFAGGGDYVLVHCGPVYHNQTVYLTVTDSNGATGSGSFVAYCGDAQ
jgi:hypothetical protein